jgi:hypothetical protein
MSKVITIKLLSAGPSSGPFSIFDEFNNLIADNVTKKQLIQGISYPVNENANFIILKSGKDCIFEKTFSLKEFSTLEFGSSKYKESRTACSWRHLENQQIYNVFYGTIKPYVIEYPFSYKFHDEIAQNVKDYTKAYTYLPSVTGRFNLNNKVMVDDAWFNKAILYNGQQSSGILNLVPKPLNNMKEYMSYPKFNSDSKTILFTKSDNFYQYNTFWALQKSSQVPLFLTSCESMSIDKVVNQDNMDYSSRSFKKSTIRAKDLKVRHILDNRSDLHLVSQFTMFNSQISYK